MLLSVRFNGPVSVTGIVRLVLRGGDEDVPLAGSGSGSPGPGTAAGSTCYADYNSGNNTNILTFEYLATPASGTARLDCTGADSLDVTYGSIFRLSALPQIRAIVKLNVRGSYISLGRLTNIIIDPLPAGAVGVAALGAAQSFKGNTTGRTVPNTGTGPDPLPILPLSSFSINMGGPYPMSLYVGANTAFSVDSGEVQRIVYRYGQEYGSVLVSVNNSIEALSALQGSMEGPIVLREIFKSKDLNNTLVLLVEDGSGAPFLYTPSLGFLDQGIYKQNMIGWPLAYTAQSVLDVSVTYDRFVESGSSVMDIKSTNVSTAYPSLSLNTDVVLNRAYVLPRGMGVSTAFIINTGFLGVTFPLDVISPPNPNPDPSVTDTLPSPSPSDIPVEYQQFQFEYGGVVTRCIALTASATGVAGYSLQEALIEVPPLNRLGPTVEQTFTPNGVSVMTVTFQKPLSYPLSVVAPEKSSCAVPFRDDRVKMAPSVGVNFRYTVRTDPTVLFTATSVVPKGVYDIRIHGVKVSEQGLAPSSATLEHISPDGRVLVRRSAPSPGVGRIVSSSLSFTSAQPGGTRPGGPTQVLYMNKYGHIYMNI